MMILFLEVAGFFILLVLFKLLLIKMDNNRLNSISKYREKENQDIRNRARQLLKE